jgi:hypothetical protein
MGVVSNAEPRSSDRRTAERKRIGSRHRRGHLWQEKFSSLPMDETHSSVVARYVEMNPGKHQGGRYCFKGGAHRPPVNLAGVNDA